MIILSWNCRGLGQPRTVQELIRLVRKHCPNLVFISEARQNKEIITGLCSRLGLKFCFPVCIDGKGGGLALYWNENINVNLISFGTHHIDVRIIETNGKKWRCTFVYGEPKVQDRHEMWKLLRRIKSNVKEPWLMVGDFNETMWQHEHFSETRRNERQMDDFRKVLSFCNLHDLGFKGLPWTYNNKQRGRKNVRVRLDRAVACPLWSNLFPNTEVTHIVSSRSDHFPILVECKKGFQRCKQTKFAKYEMMWERVESLDQEINTAWNNHVESSCLQSLQEKLNATMSCLSHWSNQNFGSVNKEIKTLKAKLQRIYENQLDGYSK